MAWSVFVHTDANTVWIIRTRLHTHIICILMPVNKMHACDAKATTPSQWHALLPTKENKISLYMSISRPISHQVSLSILTKVLDWIAWGGPPQEHISNYLNTNCILAVAIGATATTPQGKPWQPLSNLRSARMRCSMQSSPGFWSYPWPPSSQAPKIQRGLRE